MAIITWAEVIGIVAPELSTVPMAAQTLFLAHVNEMLDVATWGGESANALKMARLYLAAHFGTGIGIAADGGDQEVASESLGGASRTYVTSLERSAGDLSSTSYGRQYLQMVKTTILRGPVIA